MSLAFATALAGCALVLAWIVGRPLLKTRRRRALSRRSLGEAERRLLRRHWPAYRRVPAALRPRLDELTAVFVGEKDFVGCGGLVVEPAMRLVIAAQACLLLLGRESGCYDRLRSVLVYPSQFVVPEVRHDEDGVVTEERSVLAGQAWDVSRIVLSWQDVADAGRGGDAYNVVIHEFAHYLDHEAGDGADTSGPGGAADRGRRTAFLQRELERLRDTIRRGEPTVLDPYAAEDAGEFFAVASEAFFEQPRELAAQWPALYAELGRFYRLDPAAWRAGALSASARAATRRPRTGR